MPLQEYIEVLARRWWIIVLCTSVAAVAAFVIARGTSPTYQSSVQLEATGRIDYGQVLAMDRLLRQLAARVTTSAVAEQVDERLQLDLGVDALLAHVHTQVLPDILHIEIDVDDAAPGRAEDIARAFAEVSQEQQMALMAGVPEQERINLTVFDRPTHAHPVGAPTRSIVAAAGLLGFMAGTALAFVLDSVEWWRRRPARTAPIEPLLTPAHARSVEADQP